MRTKNAAYFYGKIHGQQSVFPFTCQFELTYRCSFDCIHCYSRCLEGKAPELGLSEIKKILDQLREQGCVWLAFTGGECLMRKDFLDIYEYARKSGFLVSILSNGYGFNNKIIKQLAQSPPYLVEITLNGITNRIFEKITRTKNALPRVLANIRALKKHGIPLLVKTNLMQTNKNEVVKIKRWVGKTLEKTGGRWRFSYDPFILPRMDRDQSPCGQRLDFGEISKILKKDRDMQNEHAVRLSCPMPKAKRPGNALYWCDSWKHQFYISPQGRLKFCNFSDKFSVDLKKVPFRRAFYGMARKITSAKFKSKSGCRSCRLRPLCGYCPARAELETGDEESPIPFFCDLAQDLAAAMKKRR